jgi:hypothetical protein
MRSPLLVLCISCIAACSNSPSDREGSNKSRGKGQFDTAKASLVLRTSHDSEQLEELAISLCESQDPAALELVLCLLEDAGFWARLDSKEVYNYAEKELRLRRVLMAVGKLPPGKANAALLRLTQNDDFMRRPARVSYEMQGRVNALMHACGEVREPSEKLLDFLDSQAKPGSGYSYLIVPILARMRSPAASRRIEAHFLAAPDNDRSRPYWFTMDLLPYRDDLAIVQLYRRLLTSDLRDASLRHTMVQAVFDYRPKDWYSPNKIEYYKRIYKLPPRREAATETLEELLTIADICSKLDLNETTRASVLKGRKEIETILEFRRSGGPERIAKLIAQLDDNSFQMRDQATRDLEKYGDWAEPALREALRANISAEMRERISRLLRARCRSRCRQRPTG